ncbi:MAG: hypothetical protein GH150_03545 [Hadesarchaea archaeon]|nr:hypothetical protein [Hadesarchaea archaeon]
MDLSRYRLERDDFKRMEKLAQQTKLGKSEIARRLITIGLKHVQKAGDLLKA